MPLRNWLSQQEEEIRDEEPEPQQRIEDDPEPDDPEPVFVQ